jgi:hypothetical protein
MVSFLSQLSQTASSMIGFLLSTLHLISDTTVSAAQNRVFQGPRLLLRNPSQSLAENVRHLIMLIQVELPQHPSW